MQLNGLNEFSLMLILAFCSEGLGSGNWTITIDRTVTAQRGSDVTINCTFDCPSSHCSDNVQIYWKKRKGKSFDKADNSQNEFVFHKNKTFVLERYREKTKLVQDKGNKDCSLKIQDVTDNDKDIYVRLITKSDKYSFYSNTVSIRVFDRKNTSPTVETTTTAIIPTISPTTVYTAIFVPLSVLVIILIIIGTFCLMKHKRKQSMSREGSGYYANFPRASSNNAKRFVL
ncbi:uncharacterized protein LOC117813761 [Xyrichtys novacula]|uniref:Uncharacterized protein LOC117813761 n=1 Tax=Xyrichtys novacula TaxID=13765 RepID=A0AAV1FKD0_XYRNO|nr:uncharacterized protein LOC117813761 [Xyrichtys novacula]